MAAHYSVIRFVPDPIADERVNVGVVVIEDGKASCRFVNRWRRVRDFAARDVKYLKEFSFEFRARCKASDAPNWSPADLSRMSREWGASIQFSEPRASLRSGLELIEEIEARFLLQPAIQLQGYRTKKDAIDLGYRAIRAEVRLRVGAGATTLLKRKYQLVGEHAAHHFDIAGANGKPIFAAQAFSLEAVDAATVERDINATGWAFQDVRKRAEEFPLAILALGLVAEPQMEAAKFENLKRVQSVAAELEVPLFGTTEELGNWAGDRITAAIQH